MLHLAHSDDYPADERIDRYRDAMVNQSMPILVRSLGEGGFAFSHEMLDLGVVAVSRAHHRIEGAADFVRTPRLIRQADPEAYRLMINLRGRNVMSADGRETVLGPGDVALFDSSRPFSVVRTAGDGPHHEFAMVTVPRVQLAVPHAAVRELTAARLRSAPARLISGFLSGFANEVWDYRRADAARLATTVVDLTATLITAEAGDARPLPPPTARHVLVERAQQHILRSLHDRSLGPGTIAAALHVSTRTLHAAFQDHQLTVGSWIRARRLERCRRDLLDPALAGRPAHAIGAHWGFPSPAHFSRVFEAAYGMTPQDLRRSAL